MKYVIWKNEELQEPLCFDYKGNVIEYNSEKVGNGDVMICDDGYAYYRPKGKEYFNNECCMENQEFESYIDIKHPPVKQQI